MNILAVVAIVPAALGSDNLPLQKQPVWIAYQTQLSKAQGIEVRWEEHWDQEYGGNPKRQYFRLKFLPPNHIWLENEGIYRRVWNGKEGTTVDLQKNVVERSEKSPDFHRAFFLGIPGVAADYESALPKLSTSSGTTKLTSGATDWLKHESGFAHEPRYQWFFSRKDRLVVRFKEEYSYRFVGACVSYINEFNTSAKLAPGDFKIEH